MAETDTQSADITCVMIPVAQQQLLLPNVTVAEILTWRRLKVQPELPAWCAGLLGWRGETIPVVRFPVLNGADPAQADAGRCILVMNRARSARGPAFYGLIASGLPRLLHLSADDLQNNRVALGPAEMASVNVGTEVAEIPSLSLIEEQLRSLQLA